jgi:hypothetical protein
MKFDVHEFFSTHLNSPLFDHEAVDQNLPQPGNLSKTVTVEPGVCEFRQDHSQMEAIGR